MSVVNLREKTIQAKVVYYGPPLGGKTTSLKHVHRVMDPEGRSRLISLNTDQDRTLFFDFLPLSLGRIGEFTLRIQGFTVPGQVKYKLTRRFVLNGADAVVFVADSRPGEMEANLAALKDLHENLRSHGLSVDSLPLVFEYNKRDSPGAVPTAEMDRVLNPSGLPFHETVAIRGTGVFEAFSTATAAMVLRICTEYRIGQGDAAASSVRSRLLGILEAYGPGPRGTGDAEPGGEGGTIVIGGDSSSSGGDDLPDTERLLERSLAMNLRVAELLTEVQEGRTQLEARVGELSVLYRLSGAAASSLDEDRVVATVLEGAAKALRTGQASLLLSGEEDGVLRERGVHGFLYDPLSALPGGVPGLAGILEAQEPWRIGAGSGEEVLAALREREPTVRAAIIAPFRLGGRPRGVLVAYFTGPGPEPGDAACRFLGALAASASVALENARLHGAVERMNRTLEIRVGERTRELEAALVDLRQVDRLKEDFLSNMSHELMTPLAGIRSSAEILRTYADMDAVERRDFLGGIESEAVRLTHRLQDILDLSSFDSGGAVVAPLPHSAREMVQAAIDRARPLMKTRSIRAGFWPQSGVPRVLCDLRWMGRALDHLIENAVNFSPDGGEVVVTVEAVGDGVRIAVRDSGPGIAPGDREVLFHRFKQAGSVMTDKPRGLGAGLPLAKRIVEAVGGAIGLDGAPGRGTVAWIRLPAE